tara:strand:+ start:254 stop:1381 length:1128 start_codon:yes stop_codon:yes gene_type:complete
MQVPVSYKKQTVLGIILIFILLVTIEGAVRAYEITNPQCVMLKSPIYEQDFLIKNQICQDSKKIQVGYDIPLLRPIPNQNFPTLQINEFGFRGDAISQEKPDDTYRIFFVGGSSLFGWGSSSHKTTIPGYLESQIFDNFSKNIEVINAGCPMCTSEDEEFLIKNYLLQFNPDLIVVYDGANESLLYPNPSSLILDAKENEDVPKPHSLGYSSEYRTVDVLRYLLGSADSPISLLVNSTNSQIITNNISIPDYVNQWKNRWEAICMMGNEQGFSTIITLQPVLYSGGKKLSSYESTIKVAYEDGYEVYKEMVKQLDTLNGSCAKTISLEDSFDNIEYTIFFDLAHVGDEGNEIVAKKIYPHIIEIISSDFNMQKNT